MECSAKSLGRWGVSPRRRHSATLSLLLSPAFVLWSWGECICFATCPCLDVLPCHKLKSSRASWSWGHFQKREPEWTFSLCKLLWQQKVNTPLTGKHSPGNNYMNHKRSDIDFYRTSILKENINMRKYLFSYEENVMCSKKNQNSGKQNSSPDPWVHLWEPQPLSSTVTRWNQFEGVRQIYFSFVFKKFKLLKFDICFPFYEWTNILLCSIY